MSNNSNTKIPHDHTLVPKWSQDQTYKSTES